MFYITALSLHCKFLLSLIDCYWIHILARSTSSLPEANCKSIRWHVLNSEFTKFESNLYRIGIKPFVRLYQPKEADLRRNCDVNTVHWRMKTVYAHATRITITKALVVNNSSELLQESMTYMVNDCVRCGQQLVGLTSFVVHKQPKWVKIEGIRCTCGCLMPPSYPQTENVFIWRLNEPTLPFAHRILRC